MKTFETIGDVVDNAIELHRLAAKLYRSISADSSSPRARLLLDYLAQHELQMEKSLINYKKGAGNSVLHRYIQYTLEEPPEQFIDHLVVGRREFSVDDIGLIGQALDSYLVDLFEEALREADSGAAAELLKDLVELETLERRKLTQSTNSLLDM